MNVDRKRPMTPLIHSFIIMSVFFIEAGYGQFVHPGITHKRSDLDRMKYQVEAKIDPWHASYEMLKKDSKSSYNYDVQGDPTFTEVRRDGKIVNQVNYRAWNSDIRAAYYNSLRWYVSGDSRHAEKAIEIFNSWTGITSVTSIDYGEPGTYALSGGVGYIMIEAAEIIKSTYDGWSENEIQAFKDMLVYPGYSNTKVPAGISTKYGSFYWQSYQGDPDRFGNQGLSGLRTVMAMGIFMDNEIMYQRALRYIQGLPHRPDDLPYPSGPPKNNFLLSSDDYSDRYSGCSDRACGSRGSSIEDYMFNEVMTNYIWESGQLQESSRDQGHAFFALGLLSSMAEMAWNQGDDLYSHEDDRLLLGLEYSMRYNVSYKHSFPDQQSHWIPTVASGEFIKRFDRTGKMFSKAISPSRIGDWPGIRPVFEMPVAHYIGRGLKTEDEAKWILRARDIAIKEKGYETAGQSNDAIGWGGLTARRPDGCHGDPISGFDTAGLPIYTMNVLPMTIKAVNFDYFVVNGEGHTYSDATAGNAGGTYRTDENVDIQVSTEGGHHITATDSGEHLTYTVYVPETGKYDVAIRYASENSSGKISVSFDGNNKTETVSLSSTGGAQNWQNLVLQKDVVLSQGVQSMKVNIVEGGFNIYSITIADDITAKNVESLINRNNNIAVRLQNNKRLFVSNAQDGEIQILNTLGKVIFSSHINSEQEIFDMNGMTNNVYIVQIRRNGNFWSTRNNIKGSGPD